MVPAATRASIATKKLERDNNLASRPLSPPPPQATLDVCSEVLRRLPTAALSPLLAASPSLLLRGLETLDCSPPSEGGRGPLPLSPGDLQRLAFLHHRRAADLAAALNRNPGFVFETEAHPRYLREVFTAPAQAAGPVAGRGARASQARSAATVAAPPPPRLLDRLVSLTPAVFHDYHSQYSVIDWRYGLQVSGLLDTGRTRAGRARAADTYAFIAAADIPSLLSAAPALTRLALTSHFHSPPPHDPFDLNITPGRLLDLTWNEMALHGVDFWSAGPGLRSLSLDCHYLGPAPLSSCTSLTALSLTVAHEPGRHLQALTGLRELRLHMTGCENEEEVSTVSGLDLESLPGAGSRKS
jgi:hypothetical protein